MDIYISSNKDIDFTILNGRMQKTEKRETELVGEYTIKKLIEEGSLTEHQYEDMLRRIKARNLLGDWRKTYSVSKSGAHRHMLGDIYEKGLLHQWGYTLVETNLATCFLQIIKIISGLGKYDIPEFYMNVNEHADKLSKFFSGNIDTDSEVQNLLIELASKNDFFAMYIDKAITLTKGSEIITIDAFNISRKYKKLFPIEAITIPISFSLNSLAYSIVEEIRDRYRRGEKRFGCIHDYKIYYFVRDDMVDKYLNMKFTIDGVPLDIQHKIIEAEHALLAK